MTTREKEALERLKLKQKKEEAEKRKRRRDLTKLCQEELGFSITEARDKLASAEKLDRQIAQLRDFFGLEDPRDLERFVRIMCNDSTLDYYERQLRR